MAGGIGRFARKKALSQGDAAAAPAPAAGGGTGVGGGDVATPAENANDNTNDAAAPAPAAAAGERPSTAFATLGSDRPATSGSHGFSNIGAFFGAAEEDDEAMMDAAGGDDVGGGEFFSATPIEGMDDGDFGGFAGFGGFGDVEEQPPAGGDGNEANGTEAATPPAAAPPVAGGGGAGIGLFAKKRAAAAAAASAPAATTAPASAPTEQAAPTKDVAMPPPAHQNAGTGVAASMASSVANLSVFDTDLVSKGTENATSPKDAVVDSNIEQGVGGGNAKDAAMEEVPKTIPTSGDDVEDDLTEATVATTFAFEAPREDVSMTVGAKDAEPSATAKTSPYFANPAASRGHVEENKAASPPVESVTTEAVPGSPPGEEIVIPGITSNVAPPTTAGHSSPEGTFEKPEPKPASKPSSGTTLSPRQASSTQRVSLSPTPGAITNMAVSFSPKPGSATNSPKGGASGTGLDQNGLVIAGMANAVVANANVDVAQPAPAPPMKGLTNTAGTSAGTGTALSPHRGPTQRVSLSPRPVTDGGAKDTATFSPKGSDVDANVADNGIVIPGVPAAVANATNVEATGTNAGAAAANQFRLGGANGGNPTSNVGGGGNQFVRSGQPNSTSRVSSFLLRKSSTSSTHAKAPSVQNARPNTTGNSGGIGKFSNNVNVSGAETAKFAMPEAPPATNTPVPATTGQFNAQANVMATPFARGAAKNQSAVTPTPGTATAPAQTYDRVVPGMPNAQAMEVDQPRLEELTEAPPQQRPRSQTIFEYKSPTPPAKSPESSVTPKASNVNNNAAVVVTAEKNRAANSYPSATTNHSSYPSENFDALLEQFQQDIQHSTDIHEKGGNDLLELECELAHTETELLGFQAQYLDLIDELQEITTLADQALAASSE